MNYHALTAIPSMGQIDKEASRRVYSEGKLSNAILGSLVRKLDMWRGSKAKFYEKAGIKHNLTTKYVAQVMCEYKKNH